MAVTINEAGEHGAATEVERGVTRSRIDVAAPPGERHAAVANDERVDHGAVRVHGVNPSVRQEHGSILLDVW